VSKGQALPLNFVDYKARTPFFSSGIKRKSLTYRRQFEHEQDEFKSSPGRGFNVIYTTDFQTLISHTDDTNSVTS
jgi:hypothetical protein